MQSVLIDEVLHYYEYLLFLLVRENFLNITMLANKSKK